MGKVAEACRSLFRRAQCRHGHTTEEDTGAVFTSGNPPGLPPSGKPETNAVQRSLPRQERNHNALGLRRRPQQALRAHREQSDAADYAERGEPPEEPARSRD